MAIKKKRIDSWRDSDSGSFTDGTKFRLSNVRAPERYQFGGQKTTKTVAGMTGRTEGFVNVNTLARDKYGKLIVDMWNKDGSINSRMRKRGYSNKGR